MLLNAKMPSPFSYEGPCASCGEKSRARSEGLPFISLFAPQILHGLPAFSEPAVREAEA